jgi:agmatine deiminase
MEFLEKPTPREQGYYFPAEWYPHRATWLSWPHKEESWPGKLQHIYPEYAYFIKLLATGERVCINVNDKQMQAIVYNYLQQANVEMEKIDIFIHPTDDAWCRDHGPAFLINPNAAVKKIIVDWGYNAWGNKYPPFDLDDVIPSRIAETLNIPVYHPGIVMEGGSVDFNGKGTLLTTTSCLLNPNRNPSFSQQQIEQYLYEYYGAEQILWLGDGIDGDDTDGHIDDLTRFVNEDTVMTMTERNTRDKNYLPLQKNLQALQQMRLLNGKQMNIVELPMPASVYYENRRLPASYANFYIANKVVIVPTYQDKINDEKALRILGECFRDREVIGIDSTDIVWGLGSFHCLSQQEPEI